WLQELPRPLTKLTWDNALLISPAFAGKQSLATGDIVSLKLATWTITAPVFLAPGQADETVTVHLGYGRSVSGRVGTGVGFNAYAIRSSEHLFHSPILHLEKK